MSYVLQDGQTGQYRTGRKGTLTADLQKARVFKRVVDAKNSGCGEDIVVEVHLYVVPDDMMLDAFARHG